MRSLRARGTPGSTRPRPRFRLYICALTAAAAAAQAGLPGSAAGDALDSLLASPSLPLAQLERAVLERNASLASAREAWNVARIHASHEGSWEDPMLSVNVAPRTLFNKDIHSTYQLGLSQVVPVFGRRGLAREASWHMADAVGADYRMTALELLTEARKQYYEYYFAARGSRVNREITGLLEEVRATALSRYSAGTAPLQDGLQAEAELAMLDHDRLVYERRASGARYALNNLLHRPPGDSLPPPPADIALPPPPGDLAPLVAHALETRPEIESDRATVESLRSELRLAHAYRLPGLTLQAGYDRSHDSPEQWVSVGASVNLPLNFGRLRAHEEDLAAQVRQGESKLAATRDRVAMEVADAEQRVHESYHELELLQGSVIPANEQALQAVRANYSAGRTEFASVLTAERSLAEARLSYFRALSEYQEARADLDRALGDTPPLPSEVTP